MNKVFETIKGGLVCSCQAEGDSPFNNPVSVAGFAILAQQSGAVAIRTEGLGKTEYIKKMVTLPVVGLRKSYFEDGMVRITGSMAEVEALMLVGSDIVAMDGTMRLREGLTGPQFIAEVKKRHPQCVVMADIATFEEAKACVEAGADCVSTTLAGYTPQTKDMPHDGPDWTLLEACVKAFSNRVPVFAEGRFNTPELAGEAVRRGAWAVVVGSMITRPGMICDNFVAGVKKANK
ncbi:MAG: N-acetylmannosamine-6-phosphate 2-epimerase [Flavobacteriales bacterium]|nr:N-acetylmannosamine-6-phosphate 2-epimerase [Flavobacteriales bacterium]